MFHYSTRCLNGNNYAFSAQTYKYGIIARQIRRRDDMQLRKRPFRGKMNVYESRDFSRPFKPTRLIYYTADVATI